MAGAFGGLPQKAGGFQPYDADKEAMRDLLKNSGLLEYGGAIPGSTQRLAGGLTMSMPPAFEPIMTPGGGGGYQGRSTGQRIAGALRVVLSGRCCNRCSTIRHQDIGTAAGAGYWRTRRITLADPKVT